jgi:hypothetical protein
MEKAGRDLNGSVLKTLRSQFPEGNMPITKHFIAILLCALLSTPAKTAQNPQRNGQTGNAASQDVLIIIQQEQVRFTAQKAVEEMRLQVFDQAGELVYDSGVVIQPEINWPLQNGNGEAIKSGLYAYTLSIKEVGAEAGRVRRGHFIVDRAKDRDGSTDKLWVTSQNDNGVGTELTVARDEDTTIAGATAPRREERMERGEAKRDGEGETKKDEKAAQAELAVAGTGTAGQIAKFISEGEIGGSNITEVNGNVGIGTANPSHQLSLGLGPIWTSNGWGGALALENASAIGWKSNVAGNRFGIGQTNSGLYFFRTASDPGTAGAPANYDLVISDAGNVGIGTTTPTSRLTIEGQDALSVRGYEPFITFIDGNHGNARGAIQQVNGGLNLFTDSYLSGANPFGYLRLDNSGNVGIGSAIPQAKLEVASGSGDIFRLIGYEPFITFYDSNHGYVRGAIQQVNGGLNLFTDSYLSGANPFGYLRLDNSGNVGIGTATPQAKLDVAGQTRTHSLQITGGADFAENFDVNVAETTEEAITTKVEAGMVVSIDPTNPGKLQLSTQSYDPQVAGIISGAGGVKPGMVMSQEGTVAEGKYPVALSGRVYCYVDASQGAVEPGDLLTTSATPGHAMKVTDREKAQGAIIGKAMTGLKEGKGLVLVLVTLQ